MKKMAGLWVLIVFLSLSSLKSFSQCSICTRSVQQMGERPGKAFNAGILYLAGGGKTGNHSIHDTCMIKIF
jgi:hypothetical protein